MFWVLIYTTESHNTRNYMHAQASNYMVMRLTKQTKQSQYYKGIELQFTLYFNTIATLELY